MALVILPPTGIPNALNPTTAAVERDTEKREITPAVTPDNASASTDDSTAEKDLLNYNPQKYDPEHKKKHAHDASALIRDDATVIIEPVVSESETIHSDLERVALSIDMTAPPEKIIAEVLLLRQSILAKPTLDISDRQQLAEINHIIKTALADLLRLKQLDEIKALASQLPRSTGVLKGKAEYSSVVALDDLFSYSFDDDLSANIVSAKSKLAGAVVGYFYGENIEPQLPSHIDHQE